MRSSFCCWRWASILFIAVFFVGVAVLPATAAFRQGDLVPMAYKSQQTGTTLFELKELHADGLLGRDCKEAKGFRARFLAPCDDLLVGRHDEAVVPDGNPRWHTPQCSLHFPLKDWETPWDEAMRSQMPRYGRPSTVLFTPGLPDTYSTDGKLAIAFAFSHEQFVLPRVTVTEPPGGAKLNKVVLTFVYSAGDIVRIRSDSIYHDAATAGGENSDGSTGFDIEYRWDRLPEEDEQAGMSLAFAISLIVTTFLAFDVCVSAIAEANALARGNEGDGDGNRRRSNASPVGEERRRR